VPVIVVENGPLKGERFVLEPPGPFTCGRDSGVHVPVKDPMVSRRHFSIEVENGGYFLVDSGSANGTLLNGARRKRHPLNRGDRIQIGETLLTFFPEQVSDPLLGRTISGFEILERIGQGGMGTVYKARQKSLDRLVALKVLSRDLAENREFIEAFHREARAAGQVNHPSIVQVYDVDTVLFDGQEITFFAMEYMAGGSVEDLINREKKLGVARALEIALDTARGLQFAERRGLVHRDIKPGNLMISESGMTKIGDLGIARMAGAGSKVSQKDGVSGSPHYISPEQARGEDLDSGADMYSLGVSLYHMLAGRPPFVGANAKDLVLKHLREKPAPIAELRPDLPAAVAALVERLMAKSRQDRFADVAALIDELERAIREQRGVGALAPHGGSPRTRAVLLTAGVAILVAVGAAGGILFDEYRETQRELVKRQEEARETRRRQFNEALEALRLALDDDKLGRAGEERERVRDLFEGEGPRLDDDLVALREEFQALSVELDRRARTIAEEERAAQAAGEWDKLSSALPPIEVLTSPEQLQTQIAPLEDFIKRFDGTPAAVKAKERLAAVEEAGRALSRKLRRAEEAFASLEGKLKTWLAFDPPAFQSALKALREYTAEFAGTSWEEKGKEAIGRVNTQMKQLVQRLAVELRNAAAERRPELLRQLQRLRLEVEGDAMRELEAILAE
jgi:tRNA A-37 threonylcarbamoyl transferase component Bud32